MTGLMPPLAKDDYDRLKASIAKDGQQIPILIDSNTGEVVDGYYRLLICDELGIDPMVETRPLQPDVATRLKVALNTARRHLTAEQKRGLTLTLAQADYTQKAIARVVGITRRRVGQIISKGSASDIYIRDQRYKLSAQDKDEIRERVEAGETQAQIAADFGITQPRVSQVLSGPAPIETPPWPPKGRYRCIIIDPPWPMKKIERETVPTQTEYLDYPTMSLEEIQALDIADLAAPDGCHVYLWTTHKFLHDALHVFAGWGAKYECLMVWHKEGGFSPYSWQYNCEFILFGRIGKLTVDRMGLKLCFPGERQGHSIKPDDFYQKVIWASPPPRLNMFARRDREGFEGWGAEA